MPDELADIEAIRQLKARYFRTLDQKDWRGYRGVFTDDVVVDTTDDSGPGTEQEGADAYVAWLIPILSDAITVHHGHMGEVVVTGPDTAWGIWSMEDHIWFPPGTGLGRLWGTGWYEEEYRRVGDEWRIARLKLRRRRVELDGTQVFPPPPPET